MSIQIHNYVLERFTFGDDDYYDIDYWDGSSYQTAKIKGSYIKAGILAGTINVSYTFPFSDGSSGQILETNGAGILSWVTPIVYGDMDSSVYDPTGINDDAFDKSNAIGNDQIKEITSFAISGDINNFGSTVPSFNDLNYIRLLTTSSGLKVTGMVAPAVGFHRVIRIQNSDAANQLTFTHEDALSTSGNQFRLVNNQDLTIRAWDTVAFFYDHVDNYWKQINS